jgi:ankyrin repeat protein
LLKSVWNVAVAEFLVSKGADVNAKTQNGWTPLHEAVCKMDCLEACADDLFIEHGVNIEVAKFLVSKGADINATNHAGWAPLHSAAQIGNVEVIKFLVSNGADVNAKNNCGKTPLDVANRDEKKTVLRELGAVSGMTPACCSSKIH